MCDWCLRRQYFCESVATTDQVFTARLVLGACSDDVAPLFPVSAKCGPAGSADLSPDPSDVGRTADRVSTIFISITISVG